MYYFTNFFRKPCLIISKNNKQILFDSLILSLCFFFLFKLNLQRKNLKT
jgi:hypothetical protein